MDNPTRWNITNSAQNIVSALIDPSKQFDGVFRREWATTFSNFPKPPKSSTLSKHDVEFVNKVSSYVNRLETRAHMKLCDPTRIVPSDGKACDQEKLTVPQIFMSDNFDLSNTETFNLIANMGGGRMLNGESTNQRAPIEKNSYLKVDILNQSQLKAMQQILTDYLDIIEEKLASKISNRSGDFFQVMSSVDSVMDELSLAIKSVTSLRRKCFKLNNDLVLPNMKSIHLNQSRDNAQAVLNKMNDISYLCKVQPMIQVLLSTSDFVGALDLIAKSRALLHKDLNQVISLRHLESQLVEIERMIGTMMQQEFNTLISSEWDGSLAQQSSAASRLSKLFEYFANGYSELSDRGSSTLLSLLQIQSEKFVNQFHEERKKRIESVLDIEKWKTIEVPEDFQRLLTMLIDDKIPISDLLSDNLNQLKQINLSDCIASGQSKDTKLPHVIVGNSSYVVAHSVIYLVRTIMDYCKCASDIRSLSTDLLERLFRIFSAFNTKTYHLVYSAGAMQVTGSKTITTRSLIVSQRSLMIINLLLPSVHRHFSQLLPNDKRLRRFDEIGNAYQEHINKIPERVRSIVKDVIDSQLQDWEAKPPVPSTQFGTVAQHITTLHENVQGTLPPCDLQSLFLKIDETFREALLAHLVRLNVKNDAGPQQWLVKQELTFHRINLAKLGAFKNSELTYDDIWSRLDESINQQVKAEPASITTNGGKHSLQ